MSGSDRILPLGIPLTEPERRRVEFAGGEPILLPDRQPWRFFEPVPVERPVRGEDGTEGFLIAWDFGADLDAETSDSLGRGWQRLLRKIAGATNDADRACGVLEAAWFLLARNYVVSQDEFEDLLLRGADDRPGKRRRLYDGLRGLVEGAGERLRAMIEAKAEAAQQAAGEGVTQ